MVAGMRSGHNRKVSLAGSVCSSGFCRFRPPKEGTTNFRACIQFVKPTSAWRRFAGVSPLVERHFDWNPAIICS
jgi:hypothetical protein